MRRLTTLLAAALLAAGLGVVAPSPLDAAPDTPTTTEAVDRPAHTPWPNFTFDVCSFTKNSKMQLGDSFFIHTSDIQTGHFGGHIVYCAARRFGASNSENSVCWAIHYEQNRLIDSWTAPRFQCN